VLRVRAPAVFCVAPYQWRRLQQIELDAETVERLDGLRIGDESDGELVNIYETSEYTLFHAGD
jgi:hypothetical protein